MSMLEEFKKFALRGNALDIAVGIIIGAAFGQIATSLVNDILMPPIGLLLSKVNFSNLFINLSGRAFATLAEAKAPGAPTLNYGMFVNTVLNFLIVALAVFLLVQEVNRWMPRPLPAPAAPPMRECPYCLSSIPIKAVRCAHCASALSGPPS